ncbi:MarR family winged helix-turn-helix transcriptional regulator [Streptomyces mutabilis]|uniref:MarR family winged helix-turn-helix transcriptional regulator n=1 Tax=Streptomyces mutabilis TaxID=67332 RepID=UPI003651A60F
MKRSVRAGHLARLTGLNNSTISRQVSALRRAGLLVSEPDPYDSRSHRLRPSPRGRELLALADAEMYREVERRTAGWAPRDVAMFHALLTRYNLGPDEQ